MAKLYFIRHQAHGIVHEFPFSEHPSQNQVAAVAKYCFGIHGFGHVETEVLGRDDMPAVADPGPVGVDAAGAGNVVSPGRTVSGVGHVTEKP
jgi:hypothetical protein